MTADRNAATIAANLVEWAKWIERYTVTMRVGTGKLHEAPDHLRDAASWIEDNFPLPQTPGRVGRCGMGMDRPPTEATGR